MKHLIPTSLIQFRKLTPITKETFIRELLKPREPTDGGGDYWKSCLSTISNACRFGDNDLIKTKIDEVIEKRNANSIEKVKNMYQANIDIMYNFEEYDLPSLLPVVKTVIEPRTKVQLTIKGLRVEVLPSHVFSYKSRGVEQVGMIWFVATKHGYKDEELGIFLDLGYRYLRDRYGKNYTINPNYCLVVDAVTLKKANYSQLIDGRIPSIMSATIEEIKKALGSRV